MSDITPTGATAAIWRWFWITGTSVILLTGALILGGWQAGWWFTSQNINREAHAIRNGYSNQQTLRDQITAKIGDVDTISTQIAATKDLNLAAALKAQRAAVAGIVCGDAAQVTGDPLQPQQAAWVRLNCLAGNLRPGSAYYQAGTP